MKYIKLFAVALGLVAISSCSDEKTYNSAAGVTVEMGQTEVSVKEHSGRFYVPINVKGDANGDIKVKIKVEGTGSNQALPFEERNGEWSGNYIVTSEELNIPKGEVSVNVEITTVDDKIQNDDRTFLVTIESVEGASIGSPASTLVTLRDNDKVPYERVQGDWTMTFRDWDNIETSMRVSLVGYDEDSGSYGKILQFEGMMSQYAENTSTSASLYFYDDEATDTRYVEVTVPQIIGNYVNDPSFSIWLLYGARNADGESGMYLSNNTIRGVVSDDYTTIVFDQGVGFGWYVATSDWSDELGGVDVAIDIVLTKN